MGNPPWEVSKPISKEFFSQYDPIYRTYGKQEALDVQKKLFAKNDGIEHAWVAHQAYFNAMTNWVKNVAFPFGDPLDEDHGGSSEPFKSQKGKKKMDLHDVWRSRRAKHRCFSDPEHPFRHQGSADLNTYKMFLELSRSLCKENGRMGMIVPSGIFTDLGTKALRELFIDRSRWDWIFCFENRKKIFHIHSSFKFGPVIVQKGGRTERIRTAFMRHDLADWEDPEKFAIDYTREQIERFSPRSRSILEIRTKRDQEILTKIYASSVLLGDNSEKGWGIKYDREFDMTNDSHLFPPKSWWEEKGYRPDQYGRWLPPEGERPQLIYKDKEIGPPGDIGLPVYQGAMIWQYDFSYQGFVSGSGSKTIWRQIPFTSEKNIEPQFVMPSSVYPKYRSESVRSKIGFRDITNSTNERTMIAALIPDYPSINAVPIVELDDRLKIDYYICLLSSINSLSYDYSLRIRVGGTHLNLHILEDTPLPTLIKFNNKVALFSARLALANKIFSAHWISLRKKIPQIENYNVKKLWAVTDHERIRIRAILDAINAHLYGLSYDDFRWILRLDDSDPKGFWRVDSRKPIQIRLTTLALAAYHDMNKIGFDNFINLNEGDGWAIPDKLKISLDDQGMMNFDDPNGTECEVASCLGPRYLPWQLEGTPEESWRECEMHARNILGDEGFKKFMKEMEEGGPDKVIGPSVKDVLDSAADKMSTLETSMNAQKKLFDY